jgi:dolichol-phosphate mannosyltransferase
MVYTPEAAPLAVPLGQHPERGQGECSPTVIVVIPTYNERENLPVCVERVLALGPRYRVIVVDDRSPDGTGETAEELAAAYPGRIEVLHRPVKEGLGPAYLAGFRAALRTGPALIATMDADLSHNPADLDRLAAAAAEADLAIGSRYTAGGGTRGWPRYRRLLSRFGGRYAATILGVPVADPTSGFKMFRRATLEAIDLDSVRSDGYVFNIEMTYRALRRGCRVVEVPIIFTDRVAGKSKLSRRIMAEAMVMVWRLRFSR